jgi:hypothetical protein
MSQKLSHVLEVTLNSGHLAHRTCALGGADARAPKLVHELLGLGGAEPERGLLLSAKLVLGELAELEGLGGEDGAWLARSLVDFNNVECDEVKVARDAMCSDLCPYCVGVFHRFVDVVRKKSSVAPKKNGIKR